MMQVRSQEKTRTRSNRQEYWSDRSHPRGGQTEDFRPEVTAAPEGEKKRVKPFTKTREGETKGKNDGRGDVAENDGGVGMSRSWARFRPKGRGNGKAERGGRGTTTPWDQRGEMTVRRSIDYGSVGERVPPPGQVAHARK